MKLLIEFFPDSAFLPTAIQIDVTRRSKYIAILWFNPGVPSASRRNYMHTTPSKEIHKERHPTFNQINQRQNMKSYE